MGIRGLALGALAALPFMAASGLAAPAPRAASSGPHRQITDEELLAYVRSPYDRRAKMETHEVLGLHRKAVVVVDFPCSDLCPENTARIVHYDVPADPRLCARVGGVVRKQWVPEGIAVGQKPFCLPRLVATVQDVELAQLQPHKPGPARLPPRLKAEFDGYFSEADYPISALRKRKSGTVQVGLDVGADGRVSRCWIRRSSGVAALDRATCRIARSRSRFQPALDASSTPTVSQATFAHSWRLPPSNAAR